MADYRYIVADLLTNTTLAELPLTPTQGLPERIGAFSTAAFTLPLYEPSVRKLRLPPVETLFREGRTALYVARGDWPAWGGIVWKTPGYDSTSGVLTLEADTWSSYFARRFQRVRRAYTDTEQLQIAANLIADAQAVPRGSIGVVVPAVGVDVPASGVLRDRTYEPWEFHEVEATLAELAAVERGFEWTIVTTFDGTTWGKRLVLGYPQLGRTDDSPGLRWQAGVLGENVTRYTVGGSAGVTATYATGAGEGDDMLVALATNAEQLDAGWPLLEQVSTYSDVSRQATLNAHARTDQEANTSPLREWAWTVKPDVDPTVSAFVLGDAALFTVGDDVRFPRRSDGTPGYQGFQRIVGRTLNPPTGGAVESVTLATQEV